jgi:hypothetical protein
MASTDTRSGFRLPWSSDRSQDDTATQDADGIVLGSAAERTASAVAWPQSDFASRSAFGTAQQRPPDVMESAQDATVAAVEPPASAPPPAPAPKKPSKLIADLAAAILATSESARDQRLQQLKAEADGIVDLIRAQSSEGAVALRRKSDEDVAAIRDWAKAEIARIKEQSETRIADRKRLLEREVADHASAIEDRCAEVESTVADYHRAMGAYFERLHAEDDPARLATMAEAMPDPPALDVFSELDTLILERADAREADEPGAVDEPEAVLEPAAGVAEAAEPATIPNADDADRVTEDQQAEFGTDPDAAPFEAGTADGAGAAEDAEGDDVPRWAAGDTPDGFPEPVEGGDPVDRGAIMAALEAAAEAVVAAEAAAESAETAEAAADVAETAAELVAGRAGARDEADPEAQAALSARVDAGGFETESYQDRLASLLPGHAEGAPDGEPRTTQVVVSGLVSVASIASFKRHLGRLAGVNGVAVASGPDGEFIFNVTHRPDVSFRDAIPTMPGFAARVVATGDGVVSVTAHDPEAEG